MKGEINTILHGIYRQSSLNITNNFSLLTGKAGILLFKMEYCKYFNYKFDPDLQDEIHELALNSFKNTDMTFCSGNTGIKWFFTYLYNKQLITKNDWQFVCSNNKDIKEIAIEMITKEKYEYLYGAVGISNYLLWQNSKAHVNFFKKFNSILNIFIINYLNREAISEKIKENAIIPGNVTDIGIAHGITGIMNYCINFLRANLHSEDILDTLNRITTFLLANKSHSHTISFYPQYLYNGIHVSKPSRLAWCTGDMMIAMQLYQTGSILKKSELTTAGIEIFKHASRRQLQEDTIVRDACFCHGSSGIAHIFNKIWKSTKKLEFLSARDFWLKETIKYADLNDSSITYKWFNYDTKSYEKDYHLLSGQAGIGMAFLSYLNDDFLWDNCLMFQD